VEERFLAPFCEMITVLGHERALSASEPHQGSQRRLLLRFRREARGAGRHPVKRPNGSILLLAHARFAAVVRNGFHEGGELQTPK
jgi:hypothetical protein